MTFKEFIISRVQIFFCLVPLILMASVLLGSVYAPEQVFHYADLLAPIITAGFCVLPTCVTYFRKEPDVKQYLLRLAIQLALIVTEVMLLISPPADVSPIRFYGALGISVCVIYALVMLMFWLQKVRQSRKLTQRLREWQHGMTQDMI